MKKVLLFQPELGRFDSLRNKPGVPLSLLCSASLLTRDYQIIIIDARVDNDWKTRVKKELDTGIVLCAGTTALTGYAIKGALEFSEFIKSNSGIPVVWGGTHASLMPEQTLEDPNIDYIIEGEGELSFKELVHALDKDHPVDGIAGLWCMENFKAHRTSPGALLAMDELPDPPYHLIDIADYLQEYEGLRTINIQSSRGCYLNCSYCYNSREPFGRWRAFSAERMIGIITRLTTEYPEVEAVYFIDDNFFVNLERAEKILNALKKMRIKWFSQGADILSLKRMSDSFIKLMEESGCIKLTVGIESGSENVRALMHKKESIQDIVATAQRFSSYNIIFYCDFMAGLPGETREDIKKTVDLLFRLNKINSKFRNSAFYIFVPYPGTVLYNNLLSQKNNLPQDLRGWIEYEWDGSKSDENKKLLSRLHFVSLFIDQKAKDYGVHTAIRFLSRLYRPIARFRLRHLFFRFMIEEYLYLLLIKRN